MVINLKYIKLKAMKLQLIEALREKDKSKAILDTTVAPIKGQLEEVKLPGKVNAPAGVQDVSLVRRQTINDFVHPEVRSTDPRFNGFGPEPRVKSVTLPPAPIPTSLNPYTKNHDIMKDPQSWVS